eukprot:5000120-Karenia_brevis.AAC.1
MAKNEELLADVFNSCAELGNVPVVITGDFNIIPDKSPTVLCATTTGVWVDVQAEVARVAARLTQPT